jgi:hypothetical protein
MCEMRRGLLATAAILAWPAAATAQEPPRRDCGWQVKVAGDQANVLYPDEAAKYWIALVRIPDGGRVEFKGRFPYGRYMSFHTYEGRFRAVDALADVELQPDPGSSNPYPVGADRSVGNRSYTVKVVDARAPAPGQPRPPNTLYNENADGSRSSATTGGAGVALRIYQPDSGRDDTGGVGLPIIETVNADGSRSRLLGDCTSLGFPNLGTTETASAFGFAGPLPRSGLSGYDPPLWFKHESAFKTYTLGFGSEATSAFPVDELAAAMPEAGIGENVHNKYIFSVASRTYGEVLLLRGKGPTFPRTFDARPVMEDGEMRYWSFCANVETSQYLACRQDDAVPLDAQRRYTIAISSAASRPSNAIERCGMTWLPFGPNPRMVLIVRHMLPRLDFAHSIQQVGANGTEEKVMGEYYPRGTYYATTAEVEKLGCSPPEFAAARRGCLRRTLRVRRRGIGPVRTGARRPVVARSAGPATRRRGRVWRWCVAGGGRVTAVFSRTGRTALVASTGRRHRARGVGRRRVGRGTRARALRRAFPRRRVVGRGVVAPRPGRSGRMLFGVRRGRVRWVAVRGNKAPARGRRLVRLLRRAGLR